MLPADWRPNLDAVIKRAIADFEALPPEEQAAIREAQRQSWVRAEMELAMDKRTR